VIEVTDNKIPESRLHEQMQQGHRIRPAGNADEPAVAARRSGQPWDFFVERHAARLHSRLNHGNTDPDIRPDNSRISRPQNRIFDSESAVESVVILESSDAMESDRTAA
jgi:hypothetical protein